MDLSVCFMLGKLLVHSLPVPLDIDYKLVIKMDLNVISFLWVLELVGAATLILGNTVVTIEQ